MHTAFDSVEAMLVAPFAGALGGLRRGAVSRHYRSFCKDEAQPKRAPEPRAPVALKCARDDDGAPPAAYDGPSYWEAVRMAAAVQGCPGG